MNQELLSIIIRMLKVTLHLDMYIITPPYNDYSYLDHELRKTLYDNFDYHLFISNLVSNMEPNTVYVITDHYESHYAFFPLPDDASSVAVVGPYIIDEPTGEFISKITENNGLKSSMKYPLQTYYHSLPLSDSQTVISTVNEIASLLYGGVDRYTVMFFNEDWNNIDIQSNLLLPNDEIVLDMQILEERYRLENALLDAISRGDRRSAIAKYQNFSTFTLENRTLDPIRNARNHGLILNTLYRKAAEKSFIHPVYLDDISRQFSSQIEQTQSIIKINNLMLEMTRKYCNLVKKHSMQGLSPLIRKTVDYINLNLSSPLSLNSLATTFSVNASYLSSMFKKEMHTTVTGYINSQRVKTAIELLNTTDLNIQLIAWHVGIDDVNYFSRIFKKIIGVTPTQYRNNFRKVELSDN